MILLILGFLAAVTASPAADKESYKDQYCTDPRTMRKHAAYTEWADAYSCTRHRCQPGGRNLAIYTVGCKRVEAPESAIECEEVVEDTNMQFPFCCTRLRCLVVVRGEVWTRVLGQPWEVLPAAPWSHMYKMKKPPPADSTFLPKTNEQGPVYELSENEDAGHDKVLRSGKKPVTDPDCNEIEPKAAMPPPDIVIALSTNNEIKETSHKKYESSRRSQSKHENSRHKRARKTTPSTPAQYFEEEQKEIKEKEREKRIEPEIQEVEEVPTTTDKPPETSEERLFANNYADSQKTSSKHGSHHQVWTEVPPNQWNDPHHDGLDVENRLSMDLLQEPQTYHAQDTQPQDLPEPKSQGMTALMSANEEKPTNLQALVDAIGTRMRDIESVVQKMSEKVHQGKPGAEASAEKLQKDRMSAELEELHKHHKDPKRHNPDGENYKRFSVLSNQGSKYLHAASDGTAEPPLIIGDTNLTGYFSDASNSVVRRNSPPKEPPLTYMAPVENRRSKVPVHIAVVSDNLEDTDKKKKKHSHKKRKGKGSHSHKKHHSKDDKRKHFNRLSSGEIEKNFVSLEDSSALTKK
ncbi:uncharacterized protein LOC118279896 isoform X3 [Spodoptera frugiperda]|uniref:Uncharacterized protein LOC118279896 isoform X3 n=1 Tax=Spodoptera frugiperda TaxID=7108 RepID=A0A9R0E5C6_SPOFR|nr:uncharacterized protein LOC118279896 isoform X3 [Spodoptera frugiperda]